MTATAKPSQGAYIIAIAIKKNLGKLVLVRDSLGQ